MSAFQSGRLIALEIPEIMSGKVLQISLWTRPSSNWLSLQQSGAGPLVAASALNSHNGNVQKPLQAHGHEQNWIPISIMEFTSWKTSHWFLSGEYQWPSPGSFHQPGIGHGGFRFRDVDLWGLINLFPIFSLPKKAIFPCGPLLIIWLLQLNLSYVLVL